MRKTKLTDRKKQAIATRQKINRTAIKLFNKDGFDRVTVDRICEKARVSKGTFYLYFDSKEQVILDLFNKTDQMYEAYFTDKLASKSDPVENLLMLGRKALSAAVSNGTDVMQITYRARINLNRSGRPRPIENRSLYKIIFSQVQTAQTQGYLREDLTTEDVTHILLRCVDGVIHAWCLADGNFDLPSEGEKVFAALLLGLRPQK